MSVTPEMLMAYADEELDSHGRAQVEQALAEDPALAETIERHRRLRRDVAATYDGLLARPVADALIARIRSALLAPQRVWRARLEAMALEWAPPWGVPLATGLALGVVLGLTLTGRAAPPGAMIVADSEGLRARGALAAGLTERLAADPATENLTIGLSFRDKTGAYCRAFVVRAGEGVSGFACRKTDAWRVRMALAEAPAAAVGDLRPAGTALPRAVLSGMEDAIEGDPLDAGEEAAARDRGWRR
jgi:hypothetical protein